MAAVDKNCSNTFEWIVLVALLVVAVGGVLIFLKLRHSGRIDGCLGKKGAWSSTGKTMAENLLIQKANRQKVKVSKDCLSCVLTAAEQEYGPINFILDLDNDTPQVNAVLTKCKCGL